MNIFNEKNNNFIERLKQKQNLKYIYAINKTFKLARKKISN
jgi:hypothetical protein